MKPPGAESRAVSRVTWAVLLLAVVASFAVLTRAKRAPHAAAPPVPSLLGAVPTGPALLVTVDVAALGEAAAVELLRAGGGALLGLREVCGFEPLLGLRQVAFALPRADPGEAPDFALIARTELAPEPVLRCAETLIRKRGGVPVRSALGELRSVRDQKKPLGEVAIRDDGLFVLSGGRYFRDVVDAANGRFVTDEEARDRGQKHAAIRSKLAGAQLLLSWLGGPGFSLPGVRGVGVSLSVGEDLELRGYVECASVADCQRVRQLLQNVQAELATEPGLAALGQGKLEERADELWLSARLPREQLGPLLAQLLAP
jgi:hypothetical protein